MRLDLANWENSPDEELVRLIRSGDAGLYEILMRRYNQRIYRIALTILRDDAEAEDVMQEAYVRAYQHLGEFAGEAKFSTWLTKIAVHEAIARVRSRAKSSESKSVSDASLDASGSLVARGLTCWWNTFIDGKVLSWILTSNAITMFG